MKKFTKILSMVLLIAMCVSMFGGSAFADNETAENLPANHSCENYVIKHMNGTGEKHAAVAAGCTTDGSIEFYMCGRGGCDKCYYDAECTELIADPAALKVAAGHSFTSVPAVEPNCKDGGNLAYQVCSVCGAVADMNGTIHENGESDFILNPVDDAHEWSGWTEIQAPTADADGREERECLNCGEKQGRDVKYVSAFEIFSKNGKYSYTYNDANDLYGYQIVDPSHKLAYVTANGAEIDVYSYDAKKGIITLDGSEFSSSKEVVIYLKFVSEDGAIVEGFSISKPANQKTEEIEVNGVGDYDYVKGSGLNVNFKTNSQLGEIVLYDMNDRVPVAAIFSSQVSSVTGIYTYTFDNDFLDSLACHTYDIRCYYGSDNEEYADAGNLRILNYNATVDNSLSFTNSELDNNRLYKYQSGAEEPRLYSPLFTISGARLQVKTDATGWSDVNVYNYLIETKDGELTAYAFLDDAYLNTLDSDNNYYFRVMVRESKMGTTEAVTSNLVTLQVGATLRPVDTAKHVINSTKNLRFVCSEKIAKVYVGNIELTDDDDFAVSTNGKTVTLSADFLNARTAGNTYTIKVLTTDGEYASTTFQILTTAQASASPRTGDTSNIGLWAAALLLSGAAAVAVLPRLKKEQ